MRIVISGPRLSAETCSRRLRAFGAEDARVVSGGSEAQPVELATAIGDGGDEVRTTISWHGPAALADRPGSEATVQAMCGLMQQHGRDWGLPRRLGIEVASVASGVLASHGVLAALVGERRGIRVRSVETSVLEAGLLLVSHYIAAATSPDPGDARQPRPGPEPGPPFLSADAHWFEIETLDPAAWREFWSALGAGDADLGWGWSQFRPRYFRGTCTLPPGLHEATRRHPLEKILRAAAASRVSLSPVRSYADVLAEPEKLGGHPEIADLRAGAPAAHAAAVPAVGDRPLEGIEIVEVTSRMQGPLAGLLLQMLGAHVVRIEPPGGDPTRLVPPYTADQGYFFTCFNRGKESLELDLASPSDRATLFDLVDRADVFLQNWRPGKAAEWGLGADALGARNPRLIYVQATGWGAARPSGRLLGMDFLVQAYTGMGYGLSPEGEPPAPSRVLLTDCLGALVACEGTLAGLFRREQTGCGARVEGSLLAGAMTLQAHVLEAVARGREESRRDGRPVWGVLDRPLETADGFVAVDAGNDAAFRLLCEVCEVDPTAGAREETERAIREQLCTAPSRRWEEALTAAGVACATVCTDLAALPSDRNLAALFEGLPGGSRAPAPPWRFGP